MRIHSAVLCLLLGACAGAQSADIAIRDATVVDVAGGVLVPDQTVLIAGNRIVAVGPAGEVSIAPDTEVIEGAGAFVIPGLWDMHVHSVANVALDTPIDSVVAWEWHYPLFLAHGVTGVRNMNDGTGDLTLERANSVKRRVSEGKLAGPPRFLNSGPSLDGDPPFGSNAVVVSTAEEARAAVVQLASNGADLIKPYENLSREAYFAIHEEARRKGIPVDGHVPFRVTAEEAAAAGQRTVEHPDVMAAGCSADAEGVRERFAGVLSNYDSLAEIEQFLVQFRLLRAFYETRDPAACATAIEAFLRHDVAVTMDLVAYHHVVHADEILADTTRMRLVPQAVRRNWEELTAGEDFRQFQSIMRPVIRLELENTRLLRDAGVTLLAGSDVGVPFQVPGISLHVELERLVEAGLTPLEALQAATLNPARVLGMDDSLGTIEAGKLADLVVLDANPLEDISNTQRIRTVIADGQLYRRADLDQLLETASAATAQDAAGADLDQPDTRHSPQSNQARNKALARGFYEDLWFSDNTDRYDRYVADEYVVHDIGDRKGVTEPAVEQKNIADFFHSQGKMTGSIDFQIADGDLVATRWHLRLEPTSLMFRVMGGREEIPIINVFRFQDGKIVEIWNHRHDIDTGFANFKFVKGLGVGFLLALIIWGAVFLLRRNRR